MLAAAHLTQFVLMPVQEDGHPEESKGNRIA